MVSFSKLSLIFALFTDSFESRRGILLRIMSTCILVLMVPMVMRIIAPLTAVTCAPRQICIGCHFLWRQCDAFCHSWDFLGRYWTKIYHTMFYLLHYREKLHFWIRQQVRGVLMDGHNQFGIRQFRCNSCYSDFCCQDSSEPSGLLIHRLNSV